MNDIFEKKEMNINEERIQSILKLRKKKLYQKIIRARLRKFDYSNLNKKIEKISIKFYKNENDNKINEDFLFNEDDYLIDHDDLDINESIKKMDFVETENILNNIIILLNDKGNLNSILYGLLMMRKFTVIEAILINQSELFIEKKLYIQICNLLYDYCNTNKKLVFESLWILSSFVFDSKDKEIYNFLINNKCIDLYRKILLCNNNKLDFYIFLEEICTLVLNLLIFKEKENEHNIKNLEFELNDEYLIIFLNELVDVIINMKINKEIYISFFIEITNCFDLYKLLKNDLLNKIIIFLIEENIKKLNKETNYYDDDIEIYYEKNNEIGNSNYKSKFKNIHQISLIQLQYLLNHPLIEMPFNYFQKLSDEIIKRMEIYLEDKVNNVFYVGYINSYISYIAELNISISYEETQKLFDYLILNIKNKNKNINTKIIIECIVGLNNLSLKMILNKMFGLLITELPNILIFIKNDNNTKSPISIKVLNEILNLLKTLIIETGIKLHTQIENEIFNDVINCVKNYHNCEINYDVKYLLEQCYNIISKIIEINSGNKKGKDYLFLFETIGMREITYKLVNINEKIDIPIFIFNVLNIKI